MLGRAVSSSPPNDYQPKSHMRPGADPLEESSSRHLFERACALASRWDLPPVTAAAVGGASDGNFTAGVGVPTLDGLGAVGGGAHAADEHVLVDRLLDRTALVAALVADVLSEVPDDE